MSLINITNLTFAYEGSYDNLFENVSFQIDTDWRLGFTGRNGRGKTTFLKLLLGKYEYSGCITSSVQFEYFPFDVTDKTLDTIDIIMNLNSDFELWEIQKELGMLEVNADVLYRPFKTLSDGEQTKVLLATLFLKENGYLLIDEPTNHLDAYGRKIVSAYLKTKKGFILVSHDRKFLDDCIDHILSINKESIDVQKGNFSTWWENKIKEDQFEIVENERLKKDIKKLKAAAKQAESWSRLVEKTKNGTRISGLRPDRGYLGHQSAKMMKRSKVIEGRQQNAVEEKSKLLKNIEDNEPLKIHPLTYHSNKLIAFNNISIYYGDKQVCKQLSFEINQGDRIALYGNNGSGKSSIIKLICGEQISYNGNIEKGSNLMISYVSQDTSILKGSLTQYAKKNAIDESLFKAILRKFGFSRVQFEKDMIDFSGGQKKKVLIARSLCEKANIYIWDEPLNFIDVLSRMQIESLILSYKPTMLFVEHDNLFAENITTKKIML